MRPLRPNEGHVDHANADVSAEPTPGVSALRDGVDPGVGLDPAEDEAVGGEQRPADLVAFGRAVDQVVAARLTPETVDMRLAQLRRATAARSRLDHEDWDHLVDNLGEYAYQVVRSWIAMITLDADADQLGTEMSRLLEPAVDALAEDVVTRAENGFRDELARIRWWLRSDNPDMRTLFLLECALHLPDAYRNWRLTHGDLRWDALENQVGSGPNADDRADLFRRLHECASQDRRRSQHLLQTIRYSESEVDEILTATAAVFTLLGAERTLRSDFAPRDPSDATEGVEQ